jgi:hypothetical protein
MTQIGRASTIDELIERVGAKLDLEITSTSIPSREQTVRWLNDGALLLARLLPPSRLGGLHFELSFDDVGETLDIDGDHLMRVVRVKKFGIECTIREQRDLSMIRTRMPLVHTTRTPACAVSGQDGAVQLEFFPYSNGTVLVKGIKRPTAYEDSGSWEPDEWSMPAELELPIVDYAVVQGKVQDEEPEQAAMLMKQWTQFVGIEIKVDAVGVD